MSDWNSIQIITTRKFGRGFSTFFVNPKPKRCLLFWLVQNKSKNSKFRFQIQQSQTLNMTENADFFQLLLNCCQNCIWMEELSHILLAAAVAFARRIERKYGDINQFNENIWPKKNSIASRGFLELYYIVLLKIRSASKIRGLLLFEAAIDLNWKIFQLFNANVSLQQFMISTWRILWIVMCIKSVTHPIRIKFQIQFRIFWTIQNDKVNYFDLF